MELPEPVRDVMAAYLAAVDGAAPGLVEGVYLVGSTVLGDFRPHTSDVDMLAVTESRPGDAALAALGRAHRALRRRRPRLDGYYVTWDDLAGSPADAGAGASVLGGRLSAAGRRRDPVAWHTLARYGVAVRGPAAGEVAVRADPAELRGWVADNLERYWARWVAEARRPGVRGAVSLSGWGAAWVVLGVPRLHYTLATGDITSKDGAGRYALEAFGERWHRVVTEALRIRRGDAGPSGYATPLARRRDVLAFAEAVIADARAGNAGPG